MSSPSPFRTPEGAAAFLAAYDFALRLWPVPYEEVEIAGSFGTTQVVVAGPLDAPPVVTHRYVVRWLGRAEYAADAPERVVRLADPPDGSRSAC